MRSAQTGRLEAWAQHEPVRGEHLAQRREQRTARALLVRRDPVGSGVDVRRRQERRREIAERVDLEIAERAGHRALDWECRQRRALHEIRGRVLARDDEERIVAERTRLFGRDGRAQTGIDLAREVLGEQLVAPERLPLELPVRLRDQHGGRDGEREEKRAEQHLEPALVELAEPLRTKHLSPP